MEEQTLFEFLTRSEIPSIPIRFDAERTMNTRSQAYPLDSTRPVLRPGGFFSYRSIMQSEYAATLFNTNVFKDPVTSPAKSVKAEGGVQARLTEYVLKRIRRALGNTTFLRGHTEIFMDTGDAASFELSDARPDLVGHTDPESSDGALRIPGDIKCSWKWHSTWVNAPERYQREEFRAVVAQLNYYMNQAESRYGYIITDAELVLFRKRDNQLARQIEMAPGIPLTIHDSTGVFTHQNGQLTALLALWYIHMFASNDETWRVQNIFSDPEEDTDPSGNFASGQPH